MRKIILWLIIIYLICMLLPVFGYIAAYSIPVLCLIGIVFLIWKIYEFRYFKSEPFLSTKNRIQSYIRDCNDLNAHIEDLRNTALVVNTATEGVAEYKDTSEWDMKRPALAKRRGEPYVHQCSRTVCDNASKAPFKYVCKYFGIKADEDTLSRYEAILNNFEAAEEGKTALRNEREQILSSIKTDIPPMIRRFSQKKLIEKLGFDAVDFNAIYFPKYVFQYTSSGGNASTTCNVTMDIANLNKFVVYLSELVKFRKSAAGQRALMTSKLRQKIKERDGYTCQCCGISINQEPHLLLEIDHIIPVSKGGLTTEDNLQTLCWRCNRSKGAKT